MSSSYNNPGAIQKALDDITTGLTSTPPVGLTQLAVSGKVSTVTDLVAELQQYLTLYKGAETAALAHEKALQARDKVAPAAVTRLEEIQAALKSALGKRNPDLHVYGLKPNHKPAPPTAEQVTVRVAKAKATRVARHTLGPKQKKAIKGQWPPASEQVPPAGGQPPPASS